MCSLSWSGHPCIAPWMSLHIKSVFLSIVHFSFYYIKQQPQIGFSSVQKLSVIWIILSSRHCPHLTAAVSESFQCGLQPALHQDLPAHSELVSWLCLYHIQHHHHCGNYTFKVHTVLTCQYQNLHQFTSLTLMWHYWRTCYWFSCLFSVSIYLRRILGSGLAVRCSYQRVHEDEEADEDDLLPLADDGSDDNNHFKK